MLNSVAVKCVWITVLETKILCLSTGALHFSCTALQRCGTPNLKGKALEELKGAVCVSVSSSFASLVRLSAKHHINTTVGIFAYLIYVVIHCTGNRTTELIAQSSKSIQWQPLSGPFQHLSKLILQYDKKQLWKETLTLFPLKCNLFTWLLL